MKNLRREHHILLPEISTRFGEDGTDEDWIHRIDIYHKRMKGNTKKSNPPEFIISYDDQHGMHFMDCEIPHDVTVDDALTEKQWITYSIKKVLMKCDKWNLKPEGTKVVLKDVKEYLNNLK